MKDISTNENNKNNIDNVDLTIPSLFSAISYTASRILFVVLSFYYLGLKAFAFIFLIFWLYELIFYYFFDLERLSGNDKYFINKKSAFQTTVGAVLELEKFDAIKLREIMIEKMFRKVRKLSAKVIHLLGDYFFTYDHISKLSENDKTKLYNEHIIENCLTKQKTNEFINNELDEPFNPFVSQSCKIFLIKYSDEEGGCIFFKVNHLISDGLSFVNLIGFLDDKVEISKFPLMMRKKPSFLYGWFIFLLECISTITVGIYNTLNDKLKFPFLLKVEEIVGKNFEHSNSSISNTNSVDFKILHKFSKENKISINEICLGALSYGVSHFFPNNNKANLLIALGSKLLEEKIENLKIENKSDGVKVPFLITKNFESNIDIFTKDIRSSLNHYYLRRIIKFFFYLTNELISLRFFVEIKKKESPADILCTNVPCQEGPIYIGGIKVVNLYPKSCSTVNIINAVFSSYAGKMNFSVAVKAQLDFINSEKLNALIKEKLESLKTLKD